MKPPAPALTSLSRRIGSPRRNASRVSEPLTSSITLGPDDLTIISSEIAALGHICQATEASLIAVPIGMSWAATSTSSVCELGRLDDVLRRWRWPRC